MEKKSETSAIRTQVPITENMEHSVPIYLTSSFTFETAEDMRAAFADEKEANIYSRFSNPNVDEFVKKMCLLEGAEAGFATASGMAAIHASMIALLKGGDHILCARQIFGATHTILTKFFPKWGIEHSYFDMAQPETVEKLIRKNTKMIFVETPSNPGLEIIDLELLGSLCKKHNLILNVDNCFATPVLQKPIEFGAHLVTHSATKYIDGQGRVMGGIVVGKKELIKEIYLYCRATGPALSPFNAWVLSKSLETLSVRMEKHCENALKLANVLLHHPKVENVKYPGLLSHPQHEVAKKQMKAGGGIITFEAKGGYENAKKFIDSLKMFSLTANLGDTRTIVTHPASSTHSKLSEEERKAVGITQSLIRISVGLENIIDIIADIEQALLKL